MSGEAPLPEDAIGWTFTEAGGLEPIVESQRAVLPKPLASRDHRIRLTSVSPREDRMVWLALAEPSAPTGDKGEVHLRSACFHFEGKGVIEPPPPPIPRYGEVGSGPVSFLQLHEGQVLRWEDGARAGVMHRDWTVHEYMVEDMPDGRRCFGWGQDGQTTYGRPHTLGLCIWDEESPPGPTSP